MGLRSGSTKGEFFLEHLGFGKKTNISINLGSWRIVLEGVGPTTILEKWMYSLKLHEISKINLMEVPKLDHVHIERRWDNTLKVRS